MKKHHREYKKRVIETLLPKIENMARRRMEKSELLAARVNYSPLAYELNFITKRNHRKAKRPGYSINISKDSEKLETVDKFLSH